LTVWNSDPETEEPKRAKGPNIRSDEYLAWLMVFHPPIRIEWCDGTVSHAAFDKLDETLAQHRLAVHTRPSRKGAARGTGR